MQHFGQNLKTRLDNAGGAPGVKALYRLVGKAVLESVQGLWQVPRQGKTACYFSAEFLIGRMVYSNLYNLGLLEEYRRTFEERGLDVNMFEEVEDAALGNGGLGRLAACFMDSGATEGVQLDGYGIRYKYGLFRQYFEDGFQREVADDWLRFGDPFSVRREDERVQVRFKGQTVWAVPYDMPVIGYGGKTVNTLRLWQAEPLQPFHFEAFNRQQYSAAYREKNQAEAITSVLYPNDDTDEGKKLRLKQQYFFCCASLQSILKSYKEAHGQNFAHFAQQYAIQLNDTHPTVAIPELLRLLMEGENLAFEAAYEVVLHTFAYTNHTIMAEALEKWPVNLFCDVLPEVYPYVVMLQNHLKRQLAEMGVTAEAQQPYYIIDGGLIYMARLALFATHSVNGVAALHTEILKHDALKEWYALYPARFSNKTNGITQRRWLGLCNPQLAGFITKRIGNGWVTNLQELEKLAPYAEDTASLAEFMQIKRQKKVELANHVRLHERGAELNADALFCTQVKRLHEYKRQLLNAFSILDIYFGIKEGRLQNLPPLTFLFGAKAAPGYYRAKGIIKFINEIAKKLAADEETSGAIQVLFVQNYNVSYAEKLIPAADISEQISTAGTEASGTGNMKFMLNGAVTLGTFDGANVEIVQKAGPENNYIFGARVEDIAAVQETYNPKGYCEANPRLRRVLDTLVDGTFSDGETGMFRALYNSILKGESWHQPDQYYLMLDFEPYVQAKLHAVRDYQNCDAFAKKCLLNIAKAGHFSSDRTIRQYANEIWGL